ncbi:hypothetical protein L6452_14203 [Arctium lappa]|uniref:Uncharacterized protein n=1 Tax=Arctium lappa TaxID=4217 RepID=A0ACB9CKS3_ARCLA|nr:hypothetical protein L6452_14203 [Arctium lappa]
MKEQSMKEVQVKTMLSDQNEILKRLKRVCRSKSGGFKGGCQFWCFCEDVHKKLHACKLQQHLTLNLLMICVSKGATFYCPTP